ncbi:MAG: hypothetical protein M0Z45_02450 [Actinomycetota bacterium]|nr:hypothetical protein [Actinomycetota bacterium]
MPKVFDSRAVTVGSASLVGALLLAYGGYLVTSTPRVSNSLQVPKTFGATPVATVAPSTSVVATTVAPATTVASTTTVAPLAKPTSTETSISTPPIITTSAPPTTSTTTASTTTTAVASYGCSSPASTGTRAPIVTAVNPVFSGGGATVQILGSNLTQTSEVLLCPTASEQIAPITVPQSATTGASSQLNVNIASLPTPAVTYEVRIVANDKISPLSSSIVIAVPGIVTPSLGA